MCATIHRRTQLALREADPATQNWYGSAKRGGLVLGTALSLRVVAGCSHLPASNAQQEADHVRLLLLLKLLHVFKGTHLIANPGLSAHQFRVTSCN